MQKAITRVDEEFTRDDILALFGPAEDSESDSVRFDLGAETLAGRIISNITSYITSAFKR
jgi:hypothetical protein